MDTFSVRVLIPSIDSEYGMEIGQKTIDYGSLPMLSLQIGDTLKVPTTKKMEYK